MPRRLNLAKFLAFVISIVAFGCLTGLVVMAAIYNSSTCPQELECSQNQPGNVIPDIHFLNPITPTHVVTTLEDDNVVEQSENAVMMTDIYDSPDKLPDFVQRTPIGNRLPETGDYTDDDSVSDQSTTIMSNNETEKGTLESESISAEPQVPEIKIEKLNFETDSDINLEKPSRKIIVMVKLNLLAPTMKRGRKKRSNLEKELIGIGLSTRDAERFTMVIDKEINGIASSAGSFDGNETAALDIEKL